MLCEGSPYRPAIMSSILTVPRAPDSKLLLAAWQGGQDDAMDFARAPSFDKFCAWAFGNAFFPRKSSCAETGSSSNAPKHEDRLCCLIGFSFAHLVFGQEFVRSNPAGHRRQEGIFILFVFFQLVQNVM